MCYAWFSKVSQSHDVIRFITKMRISKRVKHLVFERKTTPFIEVWQLFFVQTSRSLVGNLLIFNVVVRMDAQELCSLVPKCWILISITELIAIEIERTIILSENLGMRKLFSKREQPEAFWTHRVVHRVTCRWPQ